MMKNIPYGRQQIDASDIDAVRAVLESDFLTQGPLVPQFEQQVATFCQAQAAVAVNSATSALHIACLALGVGPGDEIWTSPNSFVASANCGLYCGAKVDFVDICPTTYTMATATLEAKLKARRQAGHAIPKVVIPVHFAGLSCDMRRISELAREYGFAVIEDASHAIGGSFDDQPVGSCRFSNITVFSFHPVKIITTGEGGMALTNDPELARRMQALRTHGITRDSQDLTEASHGPWYYEMQSLGFNYRMTDIQAALGLSQLKKLEQFVETRNELAAQYRERLERLRTIEPTLSWQQDPSGPECRSAYHLFVVRVPAAKHRAVFEDMRAQGIGVNLHYIPIHLQPFYKNLGFSRGQFPQAEAYYAEAMSLPLFPGLSFAELDRVVDTLSRALTQK